MFTDPTLAALFSGSLLILAPLVVVEVIIAGLRSAAGVESGGGFDE